MLKRVRSRLDWFREAVTSPGVGGILARGAAGGVAVRAAATALVFAMHVLLARWLGVASYGHYVYAITWIQLLSMLSTAGMHQGGARFVAEYRAGGEERKLKGFLRFSLRLTFVLSLVAAGATLFGVSMLGPRLSAELVRTFWVGCLLLPLLTLIEVRSGVLRGLKRIVFARLPVEVLRPLLVTGGIGLSYVLMGDGLDAAVVMALNVGASMAALGVLEVGLRRSLGGREFGKLEAESRTREWSVVGLQLLLITSASLVLGQTDTLMLGAMRSTTDAGIYTVASRLAVFVPFMLGAANLIVGPQIAELWTAGRRRELQRLLGLAARLVLAFALPAALLLWLAGRRLLGLFGADFRLGYWALAILVGAQLVNCAVGSVGSLLTMTGEQRLVVRVLGLSALVNVLLNALLIPSFGMIGAASATAATMVGWNVVMLWHSLRHCHLNPTALPLRLFRF